MRRRTQKTPPDSQVGPTRRVVAITSLGLGAAVTSTLASVLDAQASPAPEPNSPSPAYGIIDATAYGLSVAGSPVQNKAALKAAFAAADDLGAEVFVPSGTFPVSNELTWNSNTPRIRGMGDQSSILLFEQAAANGITLGPGPDGADQGSQGWMKYIGIRSAMSGQRIPKNQKVALTIDALHFFAVENVNVSGFDVGYDLRGNCMGTDFRDVRALYCGTNTALLLRSSTENGNDHTFWNCWLSGRENAVLIQPDSASGADGIHFVGGQLSSGGGVGSANDRFGTITIGCTRNYEPLGTVSQTRLTLTNTTFEGVHNGWYIRSYCSSDISLQNVGLNAFASDHPAIGLYKNSSKSSDRLILQNTRFANAHFSAAIFGSRPLNSLPGTYWREDGSSGNVTVNQGPQTKLSETTAFASEKILNTAPADALEVPAPGAASTGAIRFQVHKGKVQVKVENKWHNLDLS